MQTKFSPQGESAAPKAPAPLPHNLIVENRSSLTATGITRIVSYDENGATLEIQQGGLVVGGSGIRVSELSIQTGEVRIQGHIEYIQYSEQRQPVTGFFKRLVK